MRIFIATLILMLISACSPGVFVENALTTQERSVVRGAIDDISRGDTASLSKRVMPALAPKIPQAMAQMQPLLPRPPLDVSPLNANFVTGAGVRRAQAVYQVHGRTGWALVQASTQTSQGRTMLIAIYVQPTAGEPRSLNGFTFQRAGVPQFAMLGAMTAVVVITIAALVRIWRSGLFGRRWLWTIGALVGLTSLRMNWSTGETSFQPLMIQLFSAGAVKQPIYAPWILSVGFPLIAIIALLRRRATEEDGASVGTSAI